MARYMYVSWRLTEQVASSSKVSAPWVADFGSAIVRAASICCSRELRACKLC